MCCLLHILYIGEDATGGAVTSLSMDESADGGGVVGIRRGGGQLSRRSERSRRRSERRSERRREHEERKKKIGAGATCLTLMCANCWICPMTFHDVP